MARKQAEAEAVEKGSEQNKRKKKKGKIKAMLS